MAVVIASLAASLACCCTIVSQLGPVPAEISDTSLASRVSTNEADASSLALEAVTTPGGGYRACAMVAEPVVGRKHRSMWTPCNGDNAEILNAVNTACWPLTPVRIGAKCHETADAEEAIPMPRAVVLLAEARARTPSIVSTFATVAFVLIILVTLHRSVSLHRNCRQQ